MSGSQLPNAAYLLLALVLVGAALASRQLPIGRAWRLALIWLAIFGLAYLFVSLVIGP